MNGAFRPVSFAIPFDRPPGQSRKCPEQYRAPIPIEDQAKAASKSFWFEYSAFWYEAYKEHHHILNHRNDNGTQIFRLEEAGGEMELPDLHIGLIGLGEISGFYADAIVRNRCVTLAAVVDPIADRRTPFTLQGIAGFETVEHMLAGPPVDAAIIMTPNDRHVELCAQLIDEGKHVCCEKPLSLNVAGAVRLSRAAHDAGVVLLTAFHRRYNRNVLDLAHRLSGRRIVRLTVRYDERIEEHCGPGSWYLDPHKCGGGCVADNGPNAFDLVELLAGRFTLHHAEIDWRGEIDIRARLDGICASGGEISVRLDWAYPDGERKTVRAELADGDILEVDMLEGFPKFKSSLSHEYDGIVGDFERRIRNPGARRPAGLATAGDRAARLIASAYALAAEKMAVMG